jgi:hypothetical protein
MKKQILVVIIMLVVATLACGIPKTNPSIEMMDAPMMSTLNYNEVECPTGPPDGYTSAKCYRIGDDNIGTVVYKGSDIKAIGLIIDVNYVNNGGLDETADFVTDVVDAAGWNEDDVLNATEQLSSTDLGEPVISKSIVASMNLSSDKKYILIIYSHK